VKLDDKLCPKVYNTFLLPLVIVYGGKFCRYFIASILLWRLRLHVDLLPPSFKHMQFSRFLKNGFLLLARVIAATCCVTLSASMAARLGSVPMAAFQICLQIWLASSLLADGLAFAGQAILASAFARQDHSKAAATASRILQLGLVLGLLLSIFLGIGLRLGSRLFTDDQDVLHHIYLGIPFVSLTQPINALAFVFDGINYGASDFGYAAYSMILVAIVSIIFIVTLASYNGFVGIWIALTVYMSLRMLAGFLRYNQSKHYLF
jgi:putative MATE family efflux protein